MFAMTPASPERLRQRLRVKEQLAQIAQNEKAAEVARAYAQSRSMGIVVGSVYSTNSLDLQRLGQS
jgi:4-hydroxy-3-methylbut-2-enyl diphosphate reductase IspH